MTPTPEEQVQFLLKIQRLLLEGLFSATYKYALLMSLADLSVELGDDSGAAMEIDVESIAGKFIEYYWRQTLPYLGRETLDQNKGRQPVVVSLLVRARMRYGDQIADAQRDREEWLNLVRSVADNIRTMPLRYLQNIGKETMSFLYDPPAGKAPRKVRLYPGVAFCLRRFHGLVAELVQAAWTRWVRRQNLDIIGESADLHDFLFGSKRSNLFLVQRPLRELQRGLCFYCNREIRANPDVDHFVPWVLYQLDLGHNFVLAHSECNGAKRDRLPSEDHLAAWVGRNRLFSEHLRTEFDRIGMPHDLASTNRIARWAYNSVATVGGRTWQVQDVLLPLTGEWQNLFD